MLWPMPIQSMLVYHGQESGSCFRCGQNLLVALLNEANVKKMAVAERQQMGALLIGVERVTYLISRCRIYENLYLYSKQSGQAVAHLEPAETSAEPAVANLKSALVALYAAMLRFLAMAIRLYEKSPGKRAIHGILNPDKVVSFVQECQ